MKCKIAEWTISFNQTSEKITLVNEEDSFKKQYSVKLFRRDGMLIFPKYLYLLICQNIRYANIYDKFLNKFHDWDELNENDF